MVLGLGPTSVMAEARAVGAVPLELPVPLLLLLLLLLLPVLLVLVLLVLVLLLPRRLPLCALTRLPRMRLEKTSSEEQWRPEDRTLAGRASEVTR